MNFDSQRQRLVALRVLPDLHPAVPDFAADTPARPTATMGGHLGRMVGTVRLAIRSFAGDRL